MNTSNNIYIISCMLQSKFRSQNTDSFGTKDVIRTKEQITTLKICHFD